MKNKKTISSNSRHIQLRFDFHIKMQYLLLALGCTKSRTCPELKPIIQAAYSAQATFRHGLFSMVSMNVFA
jgi:hypothetical protein